MVRVGEHVNRIWLVPALQGSPGVPDQIIDSRRTTGALKASPRPPLHPDYVPGHALAPDAEPVTDWSTYGRAVWRYRWWVLGLGLLGTLGGAAATRILPPRYFAEATIWIQTTD